MDRLSNVQLRRALRATQELAELTDLAEYPARTAFVLRRLIPCDIASYNAVDTVSQRVSVAVDPAESIFDGGEEAFAQFAHQNPLIAHYARTGDGAALRVSDFISRSQLHHTDLYDHVYRPIGVEYQLATTVPSPRRTLGRDSEVIGLTVSRTRRDFTDAEQQLLQCLRPHFASRLQSLHELALARAISAGCEPQERNWVLLASREGTVAWSTPAAARGLGLSIGEPLPAAVRQWACSQRARVQPNGLADTARGMLANDGQRLHARLVPDAYPQLDAMHFTPLDGLPGPDRLRSLRLTRRQAEVLALAMEGQTSIQIGHALTVSPRTVEKHFDAIYARLGAGNRAQAITMALQAIDHGQTRTGT
jgi:DNA-binding CsgD family transcriptional regulator